MLDSLFLQYKYQCIRHTKNLNKRIHRTPPNLTNYSAKLNMLK